MSRFEKRMEEAGRRSAINSLHVFAWMVEHPKATNRLLLATGWVLYLVVASNSNVPWWVPPAIAGLFLIGVAFGVHAMVQSTVNAQIREVSEVDDLHPDLLRMDLADYLRNYQVKKKGEEK